MSGKRAVGKTKLNTLVDLTPARKHGAITMKITKTTRFLSAFTLLAVATLAVTSSADAQWAESGVNLGNGVAGANASADGHWTLVDSTSNVNGSNSFGHGFGIGVGPQGMSISNSVGVNSAGGGVAHNFNMTIGQNGTHFSDGGVVSQGGYTNVGAGGGSGQYGSGISGGSYATGNGNYVDAYSNSHTRRNRRLVPAILFGP